MKLFFIVIHFFLTFFNLVYSFNLDTEFPIIFKPNYRFNYNSGEQYFGFSVAIDSTSNNIRYFISAPKASSRFHGVQRTGVIFSCSTSGELASCAELPIFSGYSGSIDERLVTSNMHLGLNIAIDPKNGSLAACGHLYADESSYPSGVCFIITKPGSTDSVVTVLRPMDRQAGVSDQIRSYFRYHKYSHEMFGFTSMFSKNSDKIFLTAPGYDIFRGAVIAYNNRNPMYSSDLIAVNSIDNISENSYLGYSLTTGIFFPFHGETLAVGAPRSSDLVGQVFIMQLNSNSLSGKVLSNQKGQQIGEYFGSAIASVDLNNDGRDDLLVGAPLHMPKSNPRGDCGRVYVYFSNGLDFESPLVLDGDLSVGSRFGSSIAIIGDINHDGLIDFAVGAPYEDDGKGAVYIYSGIIRTSSQSYYQKISATQFNGLRGFGSSISHGVDVDKNGYPDILIGSHLSERAVLLRSKPIASADLDLISSVKQIDPRYKNCKQSNGKGLTCFDLTYCFRVNGINFNNNLTVSTVIKIESFDTNFNSLPNNAYLLNTNGISSDLFKDKHVISSNQKVCSDTIKVFIKGPIHDDESGLKMTLQLAFVSDKKGFCSDCPILSSGNSLTRMIYFKEP